MGRKRIEFDLEEVERLASMGLSEAQIGDALRVSVSTLGRRKQDSEGFAEALRRGRARGIAEVANAFFENALGGSVPAQIF